MGNVSLDLFDNKAEHRKLDSVGIGSSTRKYNRKKLDPEEDYRRRLYKGLPDPDSGPLQAVTIDCYGRGNIFWVVEGRHKSLPRAATKPEVLIYQGGEGSNSGRDPQGSKCRG
jgi:hypothetical protein